MNNEIKKEDYEEPKCLLNMHPEVHMLPVNRIIEKLDWYLDKNDYQSAKRHLQYWLKEAEEGNDKHGKLTVLNEQIGLYRKMNSEEECLEAINEALFVADSMNISASATYGTTLINAATGYKSFNRADEAIKLYRKAKEVYEDTLDADDYRLGGLYNNMAVTLVELKDYKQAEEMYYKAMQIMEKQEDGQLEVAITWLNMADMIADEYGLQSGEQQIEECLKKAEELLNTESLTKDGYYAFVCEKCAPVFDYYDHFMFAQQLEERAKEIYERS